MNNPKPILFVDAGDHDQSNVMDIFSLLSGKVLILSAELHGTK